MPGPWITADELAARVAPTLGFDTPSAMPAKVTSLLPQAVDAGWGDLDQILKAKGFTDAQLDTWDHRVRYNLDQSSFWFYEWVRGIAEFDRQGLNVLDHRKELSALTMIMIGGVVYAPAAAGNNTPVGPQGGSLNFMNPLGGSNFRNGWCD
jgi:hypothetical protein